jgi:phosphate starvation-inducible PhoH-like protein
MALRSREKRRTRRAQEEQFEKLYNSSNRSDILQFLPKTRKQEDLWESLTENVVTIAVGSAGTGKTLTMLWWGLTEWSKGRYENIHYIRSDVGVDHQRGRGALPGGMEEKMTPLIGPLYDNLPLMTRSNGAAEYLLKNEVIKPILLEDIRGRSFNNSFVIFDEAQNSSVEQCKTVLSRVGDNSKIAITGDTRQIDLRVFTRESGLLDAYNRLANIDKIGRVQFTNDDVVRNGIIADILYAYES